MQAEQPYVNLKLPKDLRDDLKMLAKQVSRRTMISYLERLINAEKQKEGLK